MGTGNGKRVVVTGGSGGAGLFIIPSASSPAPPQSPSTCSPRPLRGRELLAHGYTVINADREQQPRPGAKFVRCDSTNLDEVVSVTAGAHAIVHMAAIASPGGVPDQEVWRVNMTGAWNVLEAAEIHGVKKVVMASSVNALGADWGDKTTPEYFPIDEKHPTRSQDVYSVSKVTTAAACWRLSSPGRPHTDRAYPLQHLGEELAESFARRRSVQIASLRFHWLMRPEDAENAYQSYLADDGSRVEGAAKGFWSVQACA